MATSAHVSGFDYDLALSLADREVVDIIAEVFLDQWPLDKQKLTQALADNDLQSVLHVSHALKGTLAMFGAQPPSEMARSAELMASQGESEGLPELLTFMCAEVDLLVAALQRSGVCLG